MNKLIKATLMTTALGFCISGAANAYQNCDAKKSVIEMKIKQAEKFGNIHQINGLKRSLANVNAHCVDANKKPSQNHEKPSAPSVNKGDIKKLEKKISSLQKDLNNLQKDMNKAQKKHDMKKINKIKSKMIDKKQEIKQLKIELKNINR